VTSLRTCASVALLLGLVAGCQTTTDELPSSAFILQPEKIEGEASLLSMEDERQIQPARLKSLLGHRHPKARARSVLTIGRTQAREHLADAERLLADGSDLVRAQAAFSVGLVGDPASIPRLEPLVSDPSPPVQRAAVYALSLIGGDATPPVVAALLRADGHDPERARTAGEACLAVARYGDTALVADVLPWLSHGDPEIRWRAAYTLYRLAAEPIALEGALADPDARVRAYAALGLGAIADPQSVPALIQAINDPSADVVTAAADALATIGDRSAQEAFVALVNDPLPRLRWAGIQALSQTGLASPLLRDLASDDSPHVRALAIEGLRRARASRNVFRQASQDEDWRVRAAAVRALAQRGDSATLRQQIQYDPDGRVIPSVLRGLSRIEIDDLDTILLKHLEDKDPVVRATAAQLVLDRNLPIAVDALVMSYEASRSDDLLIGKISIMEALATLPNDPAILNPIKQGAGDPNWVVRSRAFELLQQLGAAKGFEPPHRVGTLRTESYYRDLSARADFDYRVTFTTERGPIVFRLYPREAQLSVAFLEEVVNEGYYTDLPLAALRPAWELLGGDDRGDGNGMYIGWTRDEFSLARFDRPQLALRRPHGRDSGSSQFLMTYLPRPDLEGELAPIGEVIAGREVLDQLLPGDLIQSVSVTSHEFTGKLVKARVSIDLPPEPETPAGAATAAVVMPGAWQRPASLTAMAIIAGVMLLLAVVPVLTSSDRRSDLPFAIWLILLILVVVGGGYTYMIMTGQYHDLLTSETPGPRAESGLPNPPIMEPHEALLASTGAMAFILLQMTLLFMFTSGRPMARWLFLFLSLMEVALFAAQLGTDLGILILVSDIGIALAMLKMFWLVMDRRTKEFFR